MCCWQGAGRDPVGRDPPVRTSGSRTPDTYLPAAFNHSPSFGPFTDEPDDVWGVVSTGVNFFSPNAQTSLFAKLDVTFGDETEGVSAKGGMRYNW